MSNEELVQLIQNGDGDAVLQLWEQIRRFVGQQAMQWSRGGFYEFDDLMQVGFIAMLRAASAYQQDKESSFINFLVYYIKQEFPTANGYPLRHDGKYDPLEKSLSLDQPLSAEDPDGDTLADLQADPRDPYEETERRIFLEQLQQQLTAVLATLPEEQQAAILHRYRDGLTLEQTGEAMHRTKAETRKLERAALDTLRKKPGGLEQFLDDRTPFYHAVGVAQYTSTHTSAVEKCVFYREQLRRNLPETSEE